MARDSKKPNNKGEYCCSKCKEWLPPASFTKNKKQTTGLSYACRNCMLEHTRTYNLISKYGISSDSYNKMLNEQCSKCDCCGKELKDKGKYKERPVVDHNHKTGKVRSLLCHKCNLALGNMDDSSEYAFLLYKYLYRYGC